MSSPSVEILQNVGQVAGVAGIAIGAMVLVLRDMIRKFLLRNFPHELAYKLLRLIVVAVWSVAILGILAWTVPGQINVASGNNNVQQNNK